MNGPFPDDPNDPDWVLKMQMLDTYHGHLRYRDDGPAPHIPERAPTEAELAEAARLRKLAEERAARQRELAERQAERRRESERIREAEDAEAWEWWDGLSSRRQYEWRRALLKYQSEGSVRARRGARDGGPWWKELAAGESREIKAFHARFVRELHSAPSSGDHQREGTALSSAFTAAACWAVVIFLATVTLRAWL